MTDQPRCGGSGRIYVTTKRHPDLKLRPKPCPGCPDCQPERDSEGQADWRRQRPAKAPSESLAGSTPAPSAVRLVPDEALSIRPLRMRGFLSHLLWLLRYATRRKGWHGAR